MVTLYHFSEEPDIDRFEPWLILAQPEVVEPFVWAVDAAHAFSYCFPRDCPRIVVWPLPTTTPTDRERWFGASEARAIAHIEYAWLERLRTTRLSLYTLPSATFVALGAESGPGNYVSQVAVAPDASR